MFFNIFDKIKNMKRKKYLILLFTLFTTFALFSCKTNSKNNLTINSISNYLYELDNNNEFIPIEQHNFGDCTGKEKFYNFFVIDKNKSYFLKIFPVSKTRSSNLLFTGDIAKFESNSNYSIKYYEKSLVTTYEFIFFNAGKYSINYSVDSFTDMLEIEVI